MSYKYKEIENTTGLEVAVIGLAGRFPQAQNVAEFWQNIRNGIDCITFFTDDELLEQGVSSELLKQPNYVKAKGCMENIENFDAHFFGYTPDEASVLDPQMRIFHEVSYEALEDSGYHPDNQNVPIGVYAGCATNLGWMSYFLTQPRVDPSDIFKIGAMIDSNTFSTRVSHKLNLTGPGFTVQTACSTSMVAIHLACQGLLSGDCNMALAGGVSVIPPRKDGYIYKEGLLFSKDGHCRTFDEAASGTVFGDGAAVVVLKLLEDALRDGDHIYAVIKGTAMNNDGNQKVAYEAPSTKGQTKVIQTAHRIAEVDPNTITYVETHGTATNLGDPIEFEALRTAFQTNKRNYCALGAVKTNVGHLNNAAGATGFIKTVLSLRDKVIAPTLHFKKSNPKIDMVNSPFYVNTALEEWETGETPRRAGVSSFGMGGTNVHAVLQEVGERECSSLGRDYKLLMLSAKTMTALDKMTENLATFIESNPDVKLEDISYTLQVGRGMFNHRRFALVTDVTDALEALRVDKQTDKFNERKLQTSITNEDNKPVIFMFSGQGSQYVNMGLDLYEKELVFRTELVNCCRLLMPLVGYNLLDILYPSSTSLEKIESANQLIQLTEISQPLVFAFEYAIAKLLMSWGITPHAMIGYSFGEYVAACLAGVFSLEDACHLIATRGKLMQTASHGVMLSVPLSEEELLPLLTDNISLAIVNGSSCIVAGTPEAINEFEHKMKSKRLLCMQVNSTLAGHSHLLDSILYDFTTEVEKITLHKPRIPFVSGITGRYVSDTEIMDKNYWVKHLRETVRFSEGIAEILEDVSPVLIEIGPGRDLSNIVNRFLTDPSRQKVLNVIRHPQKKESDHSYLLDKLGRLWTYGVHINWQGFYKAEVRHRIPLPTYPFERQRYWVENSAHVSHALASTAVSKSNEKIEMSKWFYLPAWKHQSLVSKSVKMVEFARYLIFIDNNGVGENLANQLKTIGHQVTIIRAGETFKQKSVDEYSIDPASSIDYNTLCLELSKDNNPYTNVVHFWSLTTEPTPYIDIQKSQDTGFYSLLYFLQAVGNHSWLHPFQIDVITNDLYEITGDEIISPEKATILGLCVVIPQEYTHIRCRHIDIKLTNQIVWRQNKLLDFLKQEVQSSIDETVVAYRKGSRLVRDFITLPLEKPTKVPSLKHKGIYLITGGLGQIGSVFSEYLAKTYKAKLVLTGRTILPPREKWAEWLHEHDPEDRTSQKISHIKWLEELGAEVLVLTAEVSNEDQMKTVFEQAETYFGELDGVIYAAGIVGEQAYKSIKSTTKADSEIQFQAKMKGLYVLERLLVNKQLDFCMLMSSLTSVLGGLGHTVYSAANFFMDAFSYRTKKTQTTPWISVNWDFWTFEEINSEDSYFGKSAYQLAMIPEEGVQALEYVLSACEYEQIVISTGYLPLRIDQWIKLKTIHEDKEQSITELKMYPRPVLVNPYVAPRYPLEKKLTEIWERFFGLEKVGVEDNFFELGGDSLKAITLISHIHKELQVEILLLEFFGLPDVSSMADYIANMSKSVYTEIESCPVAMYYPLSSAQKRIYVLDQFDYQGTSYNTTIALKIEGTLDIKKCTDVFKSLISRHEALRTGFEILDGDPIQRIADNVEFDVNYYKATTNEVDGIIAELISPFNLNEPPLLKVGLIQIIDAHAVQPVYIMLIDLHHIISDGVSVENLKKEFIHLYKDESLPDLSIQYKDYVAWQKKLENTEKQQKQKEFWVNQFQSELPVLDLPTDFERPFVQSFEGERLRAELNKEQTKALKKLAKEHGATLFMVMLAAYNVLLYKYTGQEDIIIGTPIAGRSHPDLERVIGIFVNTLAIRSFPTSEQTFEQFFLNVKDHALEAFENQDYPFDDLVENLELSKDLSRNPLFNTMLVMLNADQDSIELDHLSFQDYEFCHTVSKFDLTLEYYELNEKIMFNVEFCTKLFTRETIQRLIQHFIRVVQTIIENPTINLEKINLLSNEEEQQILNTFNDTEISYSTNFTLHQIFEEKVKRHPEKVALIYSDQQLTYQELNEKANQLAHYLQEKGVTTDSIIAIACDRSIEMVISIMAVLKAGGAYLPIDISFSKNRFNYILHDSKAMLLLSNVSTIMKEVDWKGEFVMLTDEESFSNYKSTDLTSISNPSDLAYIIYTSGSTGEPKGTMIEHASVVNILYAMQERYPLVEEDAYLFKTAYSFDVSVTELFGWFFGSGKLVILENGDEKDPKRMLQTIQQHGVTHINFVPSMLYVFLNVLSVKEILAIGKVKYMLVAGESVKPEMIRSFVALKTDIRLENIYGPTESTIYATSYPLTELGEKSIIPIGKPLPNIKAYILNKDGQLQPIGLPGELCLAGAGLARGYLNQTELTNEKFLVYPSLEQRIYRTGDIAKWLPDGNIQFLGRKDHQVKVRGYRIEPGEIESRFIKHEAIKEVAIVPWDKEINGISLAMYYVADLELDIQELRQYATEELPTYMIPTTFIHLDHFPLNINGKLDHKKLPKPDESVLVRNQAFVEPSTNTEKIVTEVAKEIFDRKQIGVYENFFDLGASSLDIIRFASKLESIFQQDLPIVTMYHYTSVHTLAQYLGDNKKAEEQHIQVFEENIDASLDDLKETLFILGDEDYN